MLPQDTDGMRKLQVYSKHACDTIVDSRPCLIEIRVLNLVLVFVQPSSTNSRVLLLEHYYYWDRLRQVVHGQPVGAL